MSGRALRSIATRALAGDSWTLARRCFVPMAVAYGLGARIRRAAYERGLLEAKRLATPVISVGNLTVGGTGKTPLVAWLAEQLMQNDRTVAVLTRGYGRSGTHRMLVRANDDRELPANASRDAGDEPAELARRVPGLAVVVDSARYAAGLWAERTLAPDVFLLDDGFQHYQLARCLDILVVDATDPFGGGWTLPVGRLREPVSAASRAGLVIVTRSTRVDDVDAVERSVESLVETGTPILRADHEIVSFRPLAGGESIGPEHIPGPVAVLTAIARPDLLASDLKRLDIQIAASVSLPDHHQYEPHDVDRAVDRAAQAGARVMIVTEKDAGKISCLGTPRLPTYVARLEFRCDDEKRLLDACLRAIKGASLRNYTNKTG